MYAEAVSWCPIILFILPGECLDIYPGGGLKHYSKHNNKEACEKANSIWVEFYSYIDIIDKYKNQDDCSRASTRSVPLVWGIPYDSHSIDKLQYNPKTKKLTGQKCLVQPPRMNCFVSPLSRPNHLGNVRRATPMRYTWIIPYFPSNEEKRCAFRIRYNISTGDYDGKRTFSDKNGAKWVCACVDHVVFTTFFLHVRRIIPQNL